MTEYDNDYGDDAIPKCPGCGKPIRHYEDSIKLKRYYTSRVFKWLWHMLCYDTVVIEEYEYGKIEHTNRGLECALKKQA